MSSYMVIMQNAKGYMPYACGDFIGFRDGMKVRDPNALVCRAFWFPGDEDAAALMRGGRAQQLLAEWRDASYDDVSDDVDTIVDLGGGVRLKDLEEESY